VRRQGQARDREMPSILTRKEAGRRILELLHRGENVFEEEGDRRLMTK